MQEPPIHPLTHAREAKNLTQKELAAKVRLSEKTIWSAEHNQPVSAYVRRRLCNYFKQTPQALGLVRDHQGAYADPEKDSDPLTSTSAPEKTAHAALAENVPPSPVGLPLWNVPHQRNPFFTGREEVLAHLYEALHKSSPVVAVTQQALCGLGGIGKTQIALEYAYRYRDEYQAVFWLKADTRENLLADFLALAPLLGLPERNAQDQTVTVAAVQRWLREHGAWLLIFDNADDVRLLRDFSLAGYQGHMLLTTRAQAMGGSASRITLETMTPDVGALLLLRRAALVAPDASLEQVPTAQLDSARRLVRQLDGLPLAIDQAGAYIEEVACSPTDYLYLYQTRQAELLNRRGGVMTDHPEPVTSTITLSFQKLEQASPPAADLLRFCAFLHPDAIPEEMFALGAAELGPGLQPVVIDPLALNATIGEMLKFSLVQRDPDSKTLSLHRLTQTVLKDGMDEATQRQWAERTVRVVYQAFPNPRFSTTWETCQRLLPHAQVCADLIKQWDFHFTEAIQLLNRAGYYLKRRGIFAESAVFHEQAYAIVKCFTDIEPTIVADTLDGLGILYYHQGKYVEAEPLYQQALAIREQVLGAEHPDVALTLHRLTLLYGELQSITGKNYTEVREQLYLRALAIQKKTLGPEHPDVAETSNNFGSYYLSQGKYAEAELLLLQALTIREKVLGESPDLVLSLSFLARLYNLQGKYTEAEPLLQRALLMCERVLGTNHEYIASTLNILADTYIGLGRYMEAEQCYQRAIGICEKSLGRGHPGIAGLLRNYATLLHTTQRDEEATPLEEQARGILAAAHG